MVNVRNFKNEKLLKIIVFDNAYRAIKCVFFLLFENGIKKFLRKNFIDKF